MILKLNVVLLFTAILGSVLGYLIIKTFIISINLTEYLAIEFIITVFHWLYNYSKKRVLLKS